MTPASTRPILNPPFPWYGGKRRWAPTIWEYFGPEVTCYIEPFAGSLSTLLWNPRPVARELVTDNDCGLCNFWRAVQFAPEDVAYWCDWPTIHDDLTARHKWLVAWITENRERIREDPMFYDARAAGWWVWGQSLWIGGTWCKKPNPSSQIPYIGNRPGGSGVAAQRKKRPELIGWFYRLQARLKAVLVLNREWHEVLGKSIIMDTKNSGNQVTAVLMDPPFGQEERKASLYVSDVDGESGRIAQEAFDWSLEHGDKIRVAYCCHEGDFDVPDGWVMKTRQFKGVRDDERRESRRDAIMFSPACVEPRLLW